MLQHDQRHSRVDDNIPIGTGYNHFSQELSKRNIDLEHFQRETTTDPKIEIHQEGSQKSVARDIDASLGIKLFPWSTAFKSSNERKSSSSFEIYTCRVITRKDCLRLKSDFPWDDAFIDDFGTAYFSDIHFGGILEIQVETRMDDGVKGLDIRGGVSAQVGQLRAGANAGCNNANNASESSVSINCRCHGGSIVNFPSSKDDIEMAMAEFIKSVPRDSPVVIERSLRYFPLSKNPLISIGCCNYMEAKKDECLSLKLSSDEKRKLSLDIDSLKDRIGKECITDLAEVMELFTKVIQPYPKVSKKVDPRPKVGIICLGNARAGKSQLLTTSQTNFAPKIAASGADTQQSSQQYYASSRTGHVGLIDTPGLYEVDHERTQKNAQEIRKGVKMAQSMILCLVTLANSGNIHFEDHAMIGKISGYLSRLSYDIDSGASQSMKGQEPSSGGNAIAVTLIINRVDEWSVDSYTQEHITVVVDSIKKAVAELKGGLRIQQIILVATMHPQLLEKKTDKLVEFIINTAETNELKEGKLTVTQDDVPMMRKLLTAAGAGTVGFTSGLVAGGVVDAMIISATGLAPVVAFGAVAIAGSAIVYNSMIKDHKKKRADDCTANRDIPVFVLTSKDTVPPRGGAEEQILFQNYYSS
ncbi:hypothetical protein BGZ75_002598 [Mortierella antarctica]|nr:hypothetical protein BGZ75_002598 [Mortierella antarctica]